MIGAVLFAIVRPTSGPLMKQFLTLFFTWWNGADLGTRFYTRRHGERVGDDEFGNVYYRRAAASTRRSASSGAG